MGKERQKRKELRQLLSPLTRFWRHDGRRYCAIALCASLIAGNIGHLAAAASEDPDYEFELDRVALYEALQQAVADGNTVDGDFEFAGLEADTYEISMAADGSLYELSPEIEDNKGKLNLRVFARLGEDIDLVDDVSEGIGNETSSYEIDGSEEFYFLLTNTSDQEQTAVIRVGEKETELISVVPYSDVEVPEPEGKASVNAVSDGVQAGAAGTQEVGPGVTNTEGTGEISTGTVTAGGSGSSGGGSGSGGGGSSGDLTVKNDTAVDVEISTEAATQPEIETETEVKVEETEAVVPETEVNVPETEIPETEVGSTESAKSEAPVESEDSTEIENETPKTDADVTIDMEGAGTEITEETDVSVVEDEKSEDAAVDEKDSSNDGGSTNDAAGTSNEDAVSDAADDREAASVDAAGISLHKTYRVASSKATPSDATPSDATPSDASESDMALETLDGTVLSAVRMGDASAVVFMTTADELKVSNDLEKFASPSNAGHLYEASLDTGLMVQVYANEGAFEEDVELSVKELKEDDEETAEDYQAAKDALDAENTEYTGMIALDISFLNDAGDEVEPKNGSVQVCIEMAKEILPEDVIEETLSVKHLEENWLGNIKKVHTVADNADAEAANVDVNAEDAVVTAEFEVESFSTFTITWRNQKRTLNVQYATVGSDGSYKDLELRNVTSGQIQVESGFNFSTYAPSTATGQDGKTYSFVSAVLNTGTREFKYNDVSSNAFKIGDNRGTTILQYYDATQYYNRWIEVPNNSTVYLVYGISETLPMFYGKDTSGLINIHVKNLNESSNAGGFRFGQFGEGTGINDWTGSSGSVRQGIINKTLTDGYPVVAGGNDSLKGFFTGGYDANNLFLKDKDGYYHYDSNEHFAALDTTTGKFSLYGEEGEEGYGITHAKNIKDANGNEIKFDSSTIPQFMPFNTLKSPWGKYEKENSEYYGYEFAEEEDYYFSMMVDFDFIMPKDGMVNGQPMVFEFDGDDDVWVFIDNVLVLDMGGVHLSCGGSINFATGEVTVDRVYNGNTTSGPKTVSIYELYKAAGKVDSDESDESDDSDNWIDKIEGDKSTKIFKDYSTHTLKFFYLERGAGGSNCKLRFNLPPIPEGTIYVGKEITKETNVQQYIDSIFHFKLQIAKWDADTKNYQKYKDYNGTYKVYSGQIGHIEGSALVPDANGKTDRKTENGEFTLQRNQFAVFEEGISDADQYRVVEYEPDKVADIEDLYDVVISGTTATDLSITDGSGIQHEGLGLVDLPVGSNHAALFTNGCKADNLYNLEITKKLESITGEPLDSSHANNTDFIFDVKLGGELYKGGYRVYKLILNDDSNEDLMEVASYNENDGIKLKAGQTAVISNIVNGNSFEVTERTEELSQYETPLFECKNAVEVTQGDSAEGGIAGKIPLSVGEDVEKVTRVTAVNRMKTGSLTIHKTVKSILGDSGAKFDFGLQLYKVVDGVTKYYTKTISGRKSSDQEIDEKVDIVCENNSYDFTLGNNESIAVDIPFGYEYKIVETDPGAEKYDTYITVGTKGEVYSSGKTTKDTFTSPISVTFKNVRKITVDTGILLDSMPYVLILAAAIAGAAFYFIRKKKDDEDDLD